MKLGKNTENSLLWKLTLGQADQFIGVQDFCFSGIDVSVRTVSVKTFLRKSHRGFREAQCNWTSSPGPCCTCFLVSVSRHEYTVAGYIFMNGFQGSGE